MKKALLTGAVFGVIFTFAASTIFHGILDWGGNLFL
jgi:hypothetical protein